MVLIEIATAVVLLFFDQLVKWWAFSYLQPIGSVLAVPGLFRLTYLENRGAAWGMFAGQKWILIGLTGVVLFVILLALLTGKLRSRFAQWTALFILVGGTGNLIDRIFRGYVVDYIQFTPVSFPVFNLADICVVMGCILFLLYILVIEPREKKAQKS